MAVGVCNRPGQKYAVAGANYIGVLSSTPQQFIAHIAADNKTRKPHSVGNRTNTFQQIPFLERTVYVHLRAKLKFTVNLTNHSVS